MIPGKNNYYKPFFSYIKIAFFIHLSHAFGDIDKSHFETDADLPITAIVD